MRSAVPLMFILLLALGVPAQGSEKRADEDYKAAVFRDGAAKQVRLSIAVRKDRLVSNQTLDGWHWVYQTITHGQSFVATGAKIESLSLRVAQLNENRPTAPLQVEIRDPSLQNIYFLGTIQSDTLERDFRWQQVFAQHSAPLKVGEKYVLLFHSLQNQNTSPWAINASYSDVYREGQHWYNYNEDFFFQVNFQGGGGLNVKPIVPYGRISLPINSGTEGAIVTGNRLTLPGFGELPQGVLTVP